jgi:peptidyl-prolyl cis-trans isomerase SurA
MKKILFLLLPPFILQAQNPVENKTKEAEEVSTEKNSSIDVDSKKIAREKLEGYRQRVLNGESMGTLATLYSDDPGSVKTGGLYMNVARGQFVPEFEAAAFNLEPGAISEVFETQYGFHFVQLVARRGDVIDVRHILVKPK